MVKVTGIDVAQARLDERQQRQYCQGDNTEAGYAQLKGQPDLIESIPGSGALTAAKLVALAGLNPAHPESGTSIRKKPQLSKTGKASLRAALYMPAILAKRRTPL